MSALFTVWASGWYATDLLTVADFGATVTQCEAAFGHPTGLTYAQRRIFPRSVIYYKQGWFIMVGYSEEDRAEQFNFWKAYLPITRPPPMDEQEQESLLGKYRDGSAWVFHDDASGPIWRRADDQGYASYITDSRWMVFINKPGFDRTLKSLGLPVETPP